MCLCHTNSAYCVLLSCCHSIIAVWRDYEWEQMLRGVPANDENAFVCNSLHTVLCNVWLKITQPNCWVNYLYNYMSLGNSLLHVLCLHGAFFLMWCWFTMHNSLLMEVNMGQAMELPAFLLPGFAINWEQNQVTRQWQFHGLTHIQSNILTGFTLIVAVLQTLYALFTLFATRFNTWDGGIYISFIWCW